MTDDNNSSSPNDLYAQVATAMGVTTTPPDPVDAAKVLLGTRLDGVSTWDRMRVERAVAATLTLRDALVAAGLDEIAVHFDGYGDEGSIYLGTDPSDDTYADAPEAVRTAAVDWGYAVLSQRASGWENGDGAFGVVTLHTVDGSVELEFNERYTESRETKDRWSLIDPDSLLRTI